MPKTYSKALGLLVQKSLPSSEEWLKLIEARTNLLKPHLNRVTLPELGQLECLRQEAHHHTIAWDHPRVDGDESLSLETQGIFHEGPYNASRQSDRKKLIWGFTRNGTWVLVELDFVHESGYKNRGYERATNVRIRNATLEEVITETDEKPEIIWERLGNAARSWAESRRALYQSALELVSTLDMEDSALYTIEINLEEARPINQPE